ncbi:MAG TPA: histidine kinase [Peptococcaceae bacterium]|nr:MAG: Histidine kinase [Clostridia bacterium 41_269]HBT20214.1 histidine kinase [Peptococcaceae bacterium]
MLDINVLDKILRETVENIRKSQEQIFSIAENAREECERVRLELEDVKQKTSLVIEQVDSLEKREKLARIRLAQVSKNFNKYGEEDIKNTYENAKNLQIELALLREKEKQLKEKRYELEVRYRRLKKTVEKAENLISQIGIALDFLENNLENVWEEIEKLQEREKTVYAIIRAQEEERLRIAREIHDGPAQSLANMVMQAEYCQKLLEIRPEDAVKELALLKETARANLESIRKIIFALRPMDLDDLGLVPAVKRFLNELGCSSGLVVEFKFVGRDCRYSSAIEVAVFRIIQEAVNNAVKHSKASTLRVVLETQPSMIAAIIRDDGIGFDESNIKEDSYGIKGMRERTALLNGDIKISSWPGRGTEIMVKIPVQEEELCGAN